MGEEVGGLEDGIEAVEEVWREELFGKACCVVFSEGVTEGVVVVGVVFVVVFVVVVVVVVGDIDSVFAVEVIVAIVVVIFIVTIIVFIVVVFIIDNIFVIVVVAADVSLVCFIVGAFESVGRAENFLHGEAFAGFMGSARCPRCLTWRLRIHLNSTNNPSQHLTTKPHNNTQQHLTTTLHKNSEQNLTTPHNDTSLWFLKGNYNIITYEVKSPSGGLGSIAQSSLIIKRCPLFV